uniref:Tubulin polyglutamylase complex subunit 1 n=1 Tax=Pogona vitticeps TaxID=103695 RepID=A0A6J0TQW5_9SAUR
MKSVPDAAHTQHGARGAGAPSSKMTASEKRRPPAAASDANRPVATATGNDFPEGAAEFLLQAGVTDLVRSALLKVLEARPEEPVDFLAAYFEKLTPRSPQAEEEASGPAETGQPHLQFRLDRAWWALSLAHHSHRTAFNNNVSMAYDSLSAAGRRKKAGVNGKVYSDLLRLMCRERAVPDDLVQPLLRKITCRDHEAVPFDVFRYGVLSCLVLLEFLAKAGALYNALDGGSAAADKRACMAVLGTLEEALRDTGVSAPIRYLEAGSKLGPYSLASTMDRALSERKPSVAMKKDEFLKRASAVFIAKVKPID